MATIEGVLQKPITASSWGTIVQRIAQEVHRHNEKDLDAIRLAVIAAMNHFKAYRFHFNEEKGFEFALIEGQQAYERGAQVVRTLNDGLFEVGELVDTGPPEDMIKPISTYCGVGATNTRWQEMKPTTIETIRYNTPTVEAAGYPEFWTWFDDAMLVHPVPGSEAKLIRLDYVKDLGIPKAQWNGTSWDFLAPTRRGGSMYDSWQSDWFDDGEELIRARAKWDMYYNYYHDTENAMMQAQYIGIALNNLRKRQDGFTTRLSRSVTVI